MYTRKKNEQIAKQLGQFSLYSTADPAPPPRPVVVTKNSVLRKVLADQITFLVPIGKALEALFPGKRNFSNYMLAGDAAVNTTQRNIVGDILYGSKDLKPVLSGFLSKYGAECLSTESLNMAKGLDQIDIIRE